MILIYHIVIILDVIKRSKIYSTTFIYKSVINKFDKVQQNMGKEDELLNLVTCSDNG